jgi:acyl-CoA thioesterase
MLEKIKTFFIQKDRFAKNSGVEIVSISEGEAITQMVVKPHHLNGADVVHGGAIFTLADVAFALASNSHNRISLGINTNVSFINAAKGGTLRAYAKEIGINYKLATYNVKVYDENEKIIADFNGTVYRKNDEIVKDER